MQKGQGAAASVRAYSASDFEVLSVLNSYHSLRLRKIFAWISRTSQSEFRGESYGYSTNIAQCSQSWREFRRKFTEEKKLLYCEAQSLLFLEGHEIIKK